jgi:glucose-6-phosphate isomerase
MLARINPTNTQAWFLLKKHFEDEMNRKHMRDLFAVDSDRFNKFSITLDQMIFDYSKNIIDSKTLQLLLQLAEECQLKEAIHELFAGIKINETEHRSVLHTALRNFSDMPILVEGKDIMPKIAKVQRQMQAFCENIHNGMWKGYTGKNIKYIVNIGIGGSDLGPVMVTEALKPYWIKGISTYCRNTQKSKSGRNAFPNCLQNLYYSRNYDQCTYSSCLVFRTCKGGETYSKTFCSIEY